MDLHSLPKVELHLHLDISLGFEAARQLKPSLTSEIFAQNYVAPAKCTNLLDFLKRVPPILELEQSERGLRLLSEDIFRQQAEDNIVYAELRFAPLLHTQQGLAPQEVVRIVEEAVGQYSRESGIEARVVLCSLRHFSEEQSMETVQLVEQFRGSRVVGFDLAGDEAGYPLTAHLEAFRFAKAHDIAITSHAGEACGAQSVWETVRLIHPARIGHGVRSIEDPALVQLLKQERIHLEICPSCNIQLDVFPAYQQHSIDRLYRQDLSVGISTDNRTLTPITLTAEYEKLAGSFGWERADFLKCNLNAIEAAFIPTSLKADLKKRILKSYEATNQ